MVNFIDDEQVELAAEARHVAVRALEGRDRDRFDSLLAVAETAHGTGVDAAELPQPLLKKCPRRHETERTNGRSREDGDCNTGLPAARRQHDDPATTRSLPCHGRRLL